MANMELIGGPTGGQISSAQSSITFSNIPQTYTDLVLKVSARTTFSSSSPSTWSGFGQRGTATCSA